MLAFDWIVAAFLAVMLSACLPIRPLQRFALTLLARLTQAGLFAVLYWLGIAYFAPGSVPEMHALKNGQFHMGVQFEFSPLSDELKRFSNSISVLILLCPLLFLVDWARRHLKLTTFIHGQSQLLLEAVERLERKVNNDLSGEGLSDSRREQVRKLCSRIVEIAKPANKTLRYSDLVNNHPEIKTSASKKGDEYL